MSVHHHHHTYAHETIVERKGDDITDRQVAEVLTNKPKPEEAPKVDERPKEEPKSVLGKLVQELDAVVHKLNDRAH